MAELAALLLAFAVTSAVASGRAAALTLTATALASSTGLAFAAPMAAGWSASQAAPVAVAVAAIAVALATWPLQHRPAQDLVLDVGAVVTALTAALVAAAGSAGSLALVVALGAMLAAGAAWLRDGRRRSAALILTGVAGAAAVITQSGPLAAAWFTPQAGPWHGQPMLGAGTDHGLPFAVAVLTMVIVAAITAAGAWLRQRRSSLDALAVALPVVVVPAALASHLAYAPVFASLLVLAVGLTGWAAFTGSLAPVGGAIVATLLALDWAFAGPAPTLLALGCLAAAHGLCAWRAPAVHPAGRAVCAGLGVLGAAGFTATAVVAAGGSAWQAGLAVLGVATGGLIGSAWLSGQLGLAARDESQPQTPAGQTLIADAMELTSAVVAVAGTAPCLHRPLIASMALAFLGALGVGSAARRDRRPAFWAGLIVLEAAWCMSLAALGVRTVEAYTIPAGAIVTAFGWRRLHRQPELSSWLAYGPGLAVLLGPSLGAAWQDQGWLRPALLGVAATGVTLAGARLRLRAPLLLGIGVAALDAGRQLAPEVRALTQALRGCAT